MVWPTLISLPRRRTGRKGKYVALVQQCYSCAVNCIRFLYGGFRHVCCYVFGVTFRFKSYQCWTCEMQSLHGLVEVPGFVLCKELFPSLCIQVECIFMVKRLLILGECYFHHADFDTLYSSLIFCLQALEPW